MTVIDDEVSALRRRLDALEAEAVSARRELADLPGWLLATGPDALEREHPPLARQAERARSLVSGLTDLAIEVLAVRARLDALGDDDPDAPMDATAGAGVLLPLRLETRFTPPTPGADPDSDAARWWLRVRVEPDAVSLATPPAPPTDHEADLVARCWTACGGVLDGGAGWPAFEALAQRVGAARAAYLLRTVAVVPDADGEGFAPLTQPAPAPGEALAARPLVALPRTLDLWGLRAGAHRWELLATLEPRHELIAAQATLAAAVPDSADPDAPLPRTWWNSFSAASEVGLAARIELPDPPGASPVFTAIVCVGLGGTGDDPGADPVDLAALWQTHADAGRLGTLAPLTPTNNVAGQPTTDLGHHPSPWFTVARDPAGVAGRAAWGLTGGAVLRGLPHPDTALPDAAALLVQALWPVLWQRALKDVLGVGEFAWRLGEWSARHLCPFGPFPVLRVGDLPYGLLPVGPALSWDAVDVPAGHVPFPLLRGWPGERVEPVVAATVEYLGSLLRPGEHEPGPPDAPDASALLDRLGEVPTSPAYGSRSLPLLATLAALQAFKGADGPADEAVLRWRERWRDTFLVDLTREVTPLGPVRPFPDRAGGEHHPALDRYLSMAWENLANLDELAPESWEPDGEPPSIVVRLVRQALLLTQAEVVRLTDPNLQPWRAVFHLPDADAGHLAHLAGRSGALVRDLSDAALNLLPNLAPGSIQLAVLRQFEDVRTAAGDLAASDPETVTRALPAVLDCANHRLDAWDTAVAHRRLLRLAAAGAPWRLGAFGWVDDLRPSSDPSPATRAGLLHTPGYAQALTAAVLRDHAVHEPEDGRWDLRLASRVVRAAAQLGEDVTDGVHLSEALGREVERLVGDPARVRELRRVFPARPEWSGRRVCDGQRVLDATVENAPEAHRLPGWLSGDLRESVEALHDVLDAYADLLLTDAVHDVVLGRIEAAAAGLDAAAGLGAPPQLRALRTQREGTTVRTRVCAALPWRAGWAALADAAPGSTLDAGGPGPVEVLDPALVELARRETADPRQWTWSSSVDGRRVTLRDLGLDVGDAVVLGPRVLEGLAAERLGTVPDGGTAAGHLGRLDRLCSLLAAGVRQEVDASALQQRRTWVEREVEALVEALRAPDAGTVTRALVVARRFGVVPTGPAAGVEGDPPDDEDPAEAAALVLEARLAAAGAGATHGTGGTGRADAGAGDGDAERGADAAAAVRTLLAPVLGLPLVCPGPHPGGRSVPRLDEDWLAVVAAVRPAMARLEVAQLTARHAWSAVVTGGGSPWRAGTSTSAVSTGDEEVTVTYRSRLTSPPRPDAPVGLVVLDAWAETIPSPEHTTWAAFGFDAPRARAPQALLLAVPPDPAQPWSREDVRDVVVQARRLARVRGTPPPLPERLAHGLPTAMVLASGAAGTRLTGEV